MGSRQSPFHRAFEAGRSGTANDVENKIIQCRPQSTESNSTASQVDQPYDVDITSRRQRNELQRLEQTHGSKVHDWVDEGMPREAMGIPSKMEAFRVRKDTPVPWNLEAQNAQSVHRSTTAAADTGPAGDVGVPDSVREVISSRGQSLTGAVQRKMEDEMGESFDDVQIHTGAKAASACEDINARAFTVGNHVAFNRGEYDPESPAGQHVIAHELAHVRQQTNRAVSMLPRDGAELEVDPDPQLEREAETTAQRVMAGGEMGRQQLGETQLHVQRKLDIGDARVLGKYRQWGDSPDEIAARTRNLRGQTTINGQTLPGAVQQCGGSCSIALVQALWSALGRDTTGLIQILKHFRDRVPADDGSVYNIYTSRMRSIFSKFDWKNKDAKKRVERILRWSTSIPILNFDVKGIALALMMIQENTTNQDLTPEKQKDMQIGEDLLKRRDKYGQTRDLATSWRTIYPKNDMADLKKNFMKAIRAYTTPVAVSFRAWYDPHFKQNDHIEESENSNRHVILVYGVRVTDDGTVYVAYRDGNQKDNKTREIKLNKFLAPIHKPTIKTHLKNKSLLSNTMEIGNLRRDDTMRDTYTRPMM